MRDNSASPVNPEKIAWRMIWVLLLAAALLRGVIIWSGGQFFWPDEIRYDVSRDAANLILNGKFREGLTLPLKTGEHPGFKLAGILPALVEAKAGINERIPALFFGMFSELNLVLIWLCARRLGLTIQAQFWAVLLAACSVILFFQARHLLPYDISLSLALTGLWIGLKPEGGWRRALVVGLLAGMAFTTYMAYWLMAGTVMGLCVLRRGWKPLDLVTRFLAVSAGFIAWLGGLWLLDFWGGGHLVGNSRKFATLVYTPGFGDGWWMPWEYLYHSEGLRLGLFAAALLWSAARVIREPEHRTGRSPVFIGLAGFLVVYVGTAVASNAQVIVPTGRVIRVLLPYLCWLGGLATAQVLQSRPGRRWAGPALALLVTASAVGAFVTVLRQTFPKDFKLQADRLLQGRPPAPADTYYRFVNVENYVYLPEILPVEPVETLLAARHPYQFLPYLDECFSVVERRRRRLIDHRMRLVRMAVPESARVQGEREGMITMKARFPADRSGFSEPLLSLGNRDSGDLFFVTYLGRQLQFGMERVGTAVTTSELVEFEPGREYELGFFSDTMLPPPGKGDARREDDLVRPNYVNLISIRWEGREVLNSLMQPAELPPGEIVAGMNIVRSGRAGTAFTGEIAGVRRGGYPPLQRGRAANAEYGAVELNAWLPAAAAGVPEPLVVVGLPGRATLGYVRVLPGGKAKVGVEVWGLGAYESEVITAPSDVNTEIIFQFPALYPPVGDARWGAVPRAEQETFRSHLTIKVRGQVVLDKEVKDNDTPSLPVAFGKNPVGGSWVSERFTGKLGWRLRVPLGP